MSLNLPESATEVVNRAKVSVQREVPGSNPFLRNSWLGAIITGIANRIYDFYLQLNQALLQALPDTATGDYLIRWANIWGVLRLAATGSSGTVVFTGTAGSTVPAGTVVTASDGTEYETLGDASIALTTINVTSITRSGTTATVITDNDHNLASAIPVTIAGAGEVEYNLTDTEITVTASNAFTYEVTGSPTTPASGTITASFTTGTATVDSVELGVATNQDADSALTLQTPVAGVDNTGYVTFDELTGGTDQESDTALRSRFLDRLQNPVAQFNVAAITAAAKEVNGVTRVFVQEITPDVGQVTVYFMRDGETPAIPSAAEVAAVEARLLLLLPANTDPADLFVAAPTAVPVAFTFTAISPNTVTMRQAIEDSLDQLFSAELDVGEDLTEDAYRSTIYNTVDTVTGDRVTSFTLSTPSGPVSIASNEIATRGAVTWP